MGIDRISPAARCLRPADKNRPAPRRLDSVPGRVRVLAAAAGAGPPGRRAARSGAAAPVQLETAVHVRCAGVPARRQPARLMFQVRAGSYNTESLIGFLEDLREHLGETGLNRIGGDTLRFAFLAHTGLSL